MLFVSWINHSFPCKCCSTGSAQMGRRRRSRRRGGRAAVPTPSGWWRKKVVFCAYCLNFNWLVYNFSIQNNILRKRGNSFLAYPACKGSHCPWLQNMQSRNPRIMYIADALYANHGRGTLHYCGIRSEFASFYTLQIKHRYNVFFNMFVVCKRLIEITARQRIAPLLPLVASAERRYKDTQK